MQCYLQLQDGFTQNRDSSLVLRAHSQGVKKDKTTKKPLAYFPWLWQRTFQPLKCLEDLEPKHCESQTVETGKTFLSICLYLFETLLLIKVHEASQDVPLDHIN